MADQLSPDLQAKIQKLQTASQQLQMLGRQRSQMEVMQSESKRAKEALDEVAEDAPVYRSLGALLVRDDRAKALARLTDDLETLEIRVKRLRDQEDALQKELQRLQTEIEKALQE